MESSTFIPYQRDALRGKLRPNLPEGDGRLLRQTGGPGSAGMRRHMAAHRRQGALREHDADYRDIENFIQEDLGSEEDREDREDREEEEEGLLETGGWKEQKQQQRRVRTLKPLKVEDRHIDLLDHSKYESDEDEEGEEGEAETEEGNEGVSRARDLSGERMAETALGNLLLDGVTLNDFTDKVPLEERDEASPHDEDLEA